ncbi:ABC transporter substrate-binding protein [Neorhizobium sp. DT-125]|uniref:ABC transporter substrate-binding protein n=1 Tax=Neorhizobium sp. DT-125 TaxID=3396163 RepID=UPI003F1AFA12
MKLLSVFGALLGLALAATPAAAEKLRIGTLTGQYPIYIAIEKDYFREKGLDVEIVEFQGAQPVAVAVASGDIDIGVTAFTAGFYNLAAQGVLKIVAGATKDNADYYTNVIYVSKKAYDGGLKSVEQLPGKVFGTTQAGSSTHLTLGKFADLYKFDIKSVDVRPMQTEPASLAALSTGQLDMVITRPEVAASFVDSGTIVRLRPVVDYFALQFSGAFTSQSFIGKNPKAVEGFVAGYVKAIGEYNAVFHRKGPDGKPLKDGRTRELLDIAQKYVFKNQPDADEKILSSIRNYVPNGAVDAADIAWQLDWYKRMGFIDDVKALSDVVNASFLPK